MDGAEEAEKQGQPRAASPGAPRSAFLTGFSNKKAISVRRGGGSQSWGGNTGGEPRASLRKETLQRRKINKQTKDQRDARPSLSGGSARARRVRTPKGGRRALDCEPKTRRNIHESAWIEIND